MGSLWGRVGWVVGLMVPMQRGVGWNWGVKDLPETAGVELPKWAYVGDRFCSAVEAYVYSTMLLVVLGFASALEAEVVSGNAVLRLVANAVIGWAGAFWILNRLRCYYSFCAAVSVALGVYEQWQWPPLVGRLGDAWSVAQLWGVVYHQGMRVVGDFFGLKEVHKDFERIGSQFWAHVSFLPSRSGCLRLPDLLRQQPVHYYRLRNVCDTNSRF